MATQTKSDLIRLNKTLAAENEALRAELSQLRNDMTKHQAPSTTMLEDLDQKTKQQRTKREQIEFMRALAKALNTTVRIAPNGVIEYFVKGQGWVAHNA